MARAARARASSRESAWRTAPSSGPVEVPVRASRKDRRSRRPGFAIENPLIFYPRRAWELGRTVYRAARLATQLRRIRRRVELSLDVGAYTDPALAPAQVESPILAAVPLVQVQPITG